AAQAMTLGSVTSGGGLNAMAGTNLTAGSLNSGGNATLTATAGTLQITNALTTAGTATLQSALDANVANANIGGNLAIDSTNGTVTLAQAVVGGSSQLDAGSDVNVGSFQGGNGLTTQSGGATTLGAVTLTGGSLRSTAGSTLFAQQIDAQNGSATLNAGTSLAATSIAASEDVGLQAGSTVQTSQVQAGHDINVNAGSDVSMYDSTAGHDMTVNSGGVLTINDATAGDAVSLSAQQMTFNNVQAPNSIYLLARDGNIIATSLRTRDAYALASGDIELDAGYIGDRINLEASDITAQVIQTSTGQPLYSVLSGYQGGVAGRIVVTADAPQDWMIDRLAAVNAALATTAPNVDMASAHIEQTMSVKMPDAYVWMNQHSAILLPATVQLMQPTYDFQFHQDGVHTLTDAFIIRYSFGDDTQTPNYVAVHDWLAPDYLGESALRFNGRMLTDQTDDRGDDQVTKHAVPAWIGTDNSQLVQPADEHSTAVNINAPE
ncbi:hypothetical protein ACFO5W_16460, partial [Dyella halodurans]